MNDDRLFGEVYPALRRLAAAVSGPDNDPDDLVQEAVARVLRRGTLDDLDDPLSYLRRVIVNLARNRHRDSTRRLTILRSLRVPDRSTDHYPSDRIDLTCLTAEQRAVLFLRFVEQLTTGEIAETLDMSEQAVRARSSRAIKRLRIELDQEDPR